MWQSYCVDTEYKICSIDKWITTFSEGFLKMHYRYIFPFPQAAVLNDDLKKSRGQH